MATSQAGEALGTNFGTDAFPVDWQEGEKDLFWIFDALHGPHPVSPPVLRHRRLVAHLRPHVPPLRHAVRADWITKNVNGYLYTAAIPCEPSPCTRRRPSTRTVMSRASRAIPSTPARSGPTSAASCRSMPRTSWRGGIRGRLRPEMPSATSSTSTPSTSRDPRFCSSSPSCSRTRWTSTIATGRSTGC